MSSTETYQKNLPISWDEIHRHSKALAWKLVEHGTWTGIIAVTRGGLIPAAIVARELNIRLIETFCVSSYDKKEQREAEVLKAASLENDGENWLVIDDLVDTGNTARIIREHLPKAHIATVYAKPAGMPTVDTFVTEVSQDTWINFPWDFDRQFSQPIVEISQ